jgi:hypothetical protein
MPQDGECPEGYTRDGDFQVKVLKLRYSKEKRWG